MKRARTFVMAMAIPAILLAAVAPGRADTPGFVFPDECCYYQGALVRTVVPAAVFPNVGIDPFYGFDNGAAGQKGVVAVAPGDVDYHGGHWAFYLVHWVSGTPTVLTSQAAIFAAQASGDVTITRIETNDFLCPIQP
jgi:hypothetical protein